MTARADDGQVWFHKTGPSAWCPPSWKVAGNLRKVPANLPVVDPQNVAAAQQGDALALDRLLDELAPYVRRLCARIAPAATDDATQEALLRLLVQDTTGREETMDARLRPGWCLMQSATVVIAFAARRLGSETLLAHLEHRRAHTPLPRRSQPHDRRAALAKIDQELHTIEGLATHHER
jgi:hypothetical protein